MRARVAILSGDAVVSRALEVLLQGLGYHTRLIEEFGAGQPDELLGGAAERANMEAIREIYAGVYTRICAIWHMPGCSYHRHTSGVRSL